RAVTASVNGASAQARLVDDLLDLSRVITGRLGLEVGPVNLRDVVDAALDAVRPAANAKDITLATSLAEVGPMQGPPERRPQGVCHNVADAGTPRSLWRCR